MGSRSISFPFLLPSSSSRFTSPGPRWWNPTPPPTTQRQQSELLKLATGEVSQPENQQENSTPPSPSPALQVLLLVVADQFSGGNGIRKAEVLGFELLLLLDFTVRWWRSPSWLPQSARARAPELVATLLARTSTAATGFKSKLFPITCRCMAVMDLSPARLWHGT